MSPIADNRNLTGDKPVNTQNLEQGNQPARHDLAKSGAGNREIKTGLDSDMGQELGAAPDAGNAPAAPSPAANAPSAPPNTETRQSIFSRMTRPKSATPDYFDPPELREKKKEKKEEDRSEEKAKPAEKANEQIKAAPVKSLETVAEAAQKKQSELAKKIALPKTVFGQKAFVKRGDLKYSLWKSDDLKKMTKLGRHERSDLAQEFFPDRQFVRKDDVQKKIRGIESGKVKPPEALGTGRIARTRATNVLRSMIGEKQKRVR